MFNHSDLSYLLINVFMYYIYIIVLLLLILTIYIDKILLYLTSNKNILAH